MTLGMNLNFLRKCQFRGMIVKGSMLPEGEKSEDLVGSPHGGNTCPRFIGPSLIPQRENKIYFDEGSKEILF